MICSLQTPKQSEVIVKSLFRSSIGTIKMDTISNHRCMRKGLLNLIQ